MNKTIYALIFLGLAVPGYSNDTIKALDIETIIDDIERREHPEPEREPPPPRKKLPGERIMKPREKIKQKEKPPEKATPEKKTPTKKKPGSAKVS